MTAQLSDHLTLDGILYTVTGAEPYPIFHPDMLGIEVSPMGSWCWAGFLVEYECKEGQLFARSMNLGVFDDEPLVNGRKPDPRPKRSDSALDLTPNLMPGLRYTDVWLPIKYSGEMTFGRDWWEYPRRRNYGSARSVDFNEVKQVLFLEGKIQKVTNISERFIEERDTLIEQEEEKRAKEWSIKERRLRRVRFKRKIMEFITRKKQPMATHLFD